MTDRVYYEFEESNHLLHNIPVLRSRLKEHGYLFFRELLDKAALLAIRRDILQLADKHGLVKHGTVLTDGIYAGGTFPTSARFETSPLYREILNIESFNSFGGNPTLILLFSGLLEAEIQEHRRRIARVTFPKSFANTTPPHQDFFYIKGTEDTFTCWIPAGDCPHALGGLAILKGSNHLGFLNHVHMGGTGGYGVPHEVCASTGLQWLSTNFKLGDLLIFHGLTVHKAFDNKTEEQMRVSLEYRLQRKGEKIDPSSMEYHMKGSFAHEAKLNS